MTIAVNVMLTIESNKANYIIDVLYCQLYLSTYYFEIKAIKKQSRHQVFLFVLIQHPHLDADTDQSEFNTEITYWYCSPKLTETYFAAITIVHYWVGVITLYLHCSKTSLDEPLDVHLCSYFHEQHFVTRRDVIQT